MMENVIKVNNFNAIDLNEQALAVHDFLQKFLNKFEQARRGGIHDFMEMALFNMINESINKINVYLVNVYLESGHQEISDTEIMIITIEAYQKVLDGIKQNIEERQEIQFQ